MNLKILNIIIILIVSLTLLGCVSASDENETVIDNVEYESFVEVEIFEDVVEDVQDISVESEIPHVEVEIETAECEKIEIITAVEDSEVPTEGVYYEHVEEIQEDVNNFVNVDDSLNLANSFDIIFESNKSDMDLDKNSDSFLLPASCDLILDFTPVTGMFKTTDFSRILFKDVKIKNHNLSIKHEIIVCLLDHGYNSDSNRLTSKIVICSNKVTDNFAYSINNSVIDDDESSIIFCSFKSFFVNLNFINQSSIFLNNVHINDDFTKSLISQYNFQNVIIIFSCFNVNEKEDCINTRD